MKDLGEIRHFLGTENAKSDKGLIFCQRKYALEMISELSFSAYKILKTPMELNVKLTRKLYDKHVGLMLMSCNWKTLKFTDN